MARKKARRPTKKQTVKKKPPKRKRAKKPRWTRVTGGDRAVPPKLADTDGQIQRLWHNISTQCVSITSSIDTTPSAAFHRAADRADHDVCEPGRDRHRERAAVQGTGGPKHGTHASHG